MVARSFADSAASLIQALRGERFPKRALTKHLDEFDVAILAADDQGHYIASNQGVSALTGFTTSELLTLTVTDLVVEAVASDVTTSWAMFVEQGYQHGQAILRRKDRSKVRVFYDAFADLAPNIHVSFLTPAK